MLLFSPCSGLILTVASKTTANDTLVDKYLNDRMNDYKKYKKMFSPEKINALRNNYNYENDNLYKGIMNQIIIKSLTEHFSNV